MEGRRHTLINRGGNPGGGNPLKPELSSSTSKSELTTKRDSAVDQHQPGPELNGLDDEDMKAIEDEKAITMTTDFKDILARYVDRCSMHGISYITSPENSMVKMAWSLLLMAAIATVLYHLSRLFTSYFRYEKGSDITIDFSVLQFPAVTICNVNPMRMSKRHLASAKVNKLIDDIDPAAMSHHHHHHHHLGAVPSNGSQGSHTTTLDDMFSTVVHDMHSPKGPSRLPVFASSQGKAGGHTSHPKMSNFYTVEKFFKENYAAEDEETRVKMGHQIENMLILCYFAGQMCEQRNFNRTMSTNYGNCYTIEDPDYFTFQSGPYEGLVLFLLVETDEYLPSISEGKGFQLVIHEQGAMPFPDDEAIALAAGLETVIGLRQIEIFRLGPPHGNCKSVEEFKERYGVKYTRTTCQRACRQVRIKDKCQCYDEMHNGVRSVLKTLKGVPPCRTQSQIACLHEIESAFMKSNSGCDCDSPCSEKKFEKTISWRQWPSPSFANLIVDTICSKGHGLSCERLRNKTESEMMEEFIKLTIYFEDLNFERYTETKAYELYQFISDIGGSLGLYIGLSVLSIFEILHLLLDIIVYFVSKLTNKT